MLKLVQKRTQSTIHLQSDKNTEMNLQVDTKRLIITYSEKIN